MSSRSVPLGAPPPYSYTSSSFLRPRTQLRTDSSPSEVLRATSIAVSERARRPPNDMSSYDLDPETSKLIAQLTLQDIDEIDGSRKGKARANAPLSDEQIALRMQREYFQSSIREMNDLAMAKSLHDAIERDHSLLSSLSVMEQAAQDDHNMALALSNGRPLPEKSAAQRLVEDPAFVELAQPADLPRSVNPITTKLSSPTQRRTASSKVTDNPSRLGLLAIAPKVEGTARKAPVPPPKFESAECISCGEVSRASSTLKGPCGHHYCSDCISDLVTACTRDESLYPPRCCNQPFKQDTLVPYLTAKILAVYNIKRLELDVPASNRIFCPTPTCSAFLGSSESATSLQCTKCRIPVCPRCRQRSHLGSCSSNEATLQVKALATTMGWPTCPGCKSIVELQTGCYHMTCRCRAQFCYLCATPWKNCRCPQWDEARLLDTAQQRVEQANAHRPAVAPIVQQERVRRMANVLRDNHDCVRHTWRRQNGSGNCEECGHWMRDYLLNCRNCHMGACVRCARNRLP